MGGRKTPRTCWPVGSGRGRGGGVTVDHQLSGWLGVGIVSLKTRRRGGRKQGLERRAKEVSQGKGMLNLKCQQKIWEDLPVKSFLSGSGGQEMPGKSSSPVPSATFIWSPVLFD